MISEPIYLRAINSSKNVNRWYSLRLVQDLFGEWLVMTQWGRQGFKGQYKQYTFLEELAAKKAFGRILQKRLHAQRRIGCNYEIFNGDDDVGQ